MPLVQLPRLPALPTGRRFDVRKRYYHDLTASQGTTLSVFSQGRGLDLCLDNHRGGGAQRRVAAPTRAAPLPAYAQQRIGCCQAAGLATGTGMAAQRRASAAPPAEPLVPARPEMPKLAGPACLAVDQPAHAPASPPAGPMANLFTNINLGRNTRAFQSSGRKDRGAHTGGQGATMVAARPRVAWGSLRCSPLPRHRAPQPCWLHGAHFPQAPGCNPHRRR